MSRGYGQSSQSCQVSISQPNSHTTPPYPSSPSFNWTPSLSLDRYASLLTGGSAPLVPLSLLLSPSRPNRATKGQAQNFGGLCQEPHPALPSPSQLQLRPHKPSFLNSASLFKLPSIYSLPLPWNALIILLPFSTIVCFFFSLGDPHKMPPRPGSPLGGARWAFSWDTQRRCPLQHHLLMSVFLTRPSDP